MSHIVDRVCTELKNKFEAERDATAQAISSGLCSSYEDYRNKVGRLRAFIEAIETVEAVYRKSTGRDTE